MKETGRENNILIRIKKRATADHEPFYRERAAETSRKTGIYLKHTCAAE